ncbi:MAG: glycosyltransferase family 1 protein [Clostridia bacterium]|nr:glycosyltransferase family 1 protein [Clostridia bacterium]
MEGPIRILIVNGKMICGGVEAFIMNIYRHIDRSKIQFDFLVHYKERFFYDDEIEALGGRIHRLSFRNDNRYFKYKSDLKRFFGEHPEYRVVWGHMDGLASIYLKAAKKCGVSVTMSHSHITSAERSLKGLVKRVLRGNLCKYADRRFACSTEAGRYLYGKHDFKVMPNAIAVEKFGFDPEARARIREANGWQGKTVVGHLGRFNPQKNHLYLIDIFKAYLKRDPDAVLCLCGDGELQGSVRDYVAQCGLEDKVTFTGNISNANEYYQAFDMFVMPSLYEGLPVSGVEAQTAGLRCYFADTITRETSLVPQNVRFLSIKQDPAAWAEVLEKTDEATRAATFDTVAASEYNIQKLVEMLEKLLTDEYNNKKENL